MLDQDDRHAVAGGQRCDQLLAGLEPARRGTDPDDRRNHTCWLPEDCTGACRLEPGWAGLA